MTSLTQSNELISDKVLSEVRKAEGSDEEVFMSVSYDVPSEHLSWRDDISDDPEKVSKSLRRKRGLVTKDFALAGTKLSDSVYIVRADKVLEVIERVESRYSDTEFCDSVEERIQSKIRLDIVGRCYKHVVEELVVDYIQETLEDIGTRLEVIESKISNNSFEDESEIQKSQNRLYGMSKKIDRLKARKEDLEVLDEGKAKQFDGKISSVSQMRDRLLDSPVFKAS